jgi:hypothetical protein
MLGKEAKGIEGSSMKTQTEGAWRSNSLAKKFFEVTMAYMLAQ